MGRRAAKVGREDQLMMMMITIIIITIGYRVIVSRSLLLVPLFLSTWRGREGLATGGYGELPSPRPARRNQKKWSVTYEGRG